MRPTQHMQTVTARQRLQRDAAREVPTDVLEDWRPMLLCLLRPVVPFQAFRVSASPHKATSKQAVGYFLTLHHKFFNS